MSDIFNVKLTENALKDLKKVPMYIVIKLRGWIESVGNQGLSATRKTPGFHDEPLKGKRKGQRSIRLNRSYRAIYVVDKGNQVHFVGVIEVNKHDY